MANSANAALSDIPSGKYVLEDTHGYISFSYSHLGFSNPHIGFNSFTTEVNLDAAAPAKSSLSVNIDVASIDSRVDEFDKHLKGENFFDVANHPSITFESTGMVMTDADNGTITGNLTIMGVTKPVTLDATINKAANHPIRNVPTIGVEANTKVSRSEFGLDKYVPAVGDEVEIFITVELIKAE